MKEEQPRRFLAPLAFGLGVWGVSSAAGADCAPVAIVEGDPVLRGSIQQLLEASGLESSPGLGCPAVKAVVTKPDGRILVTVEDASGRSSRRSVASVETAAALIESWTRDDLSSPLLAPRRVDVLKEPPEPPPAAEPSPASRGGYDTALRVLLDGEASASFDGGIWFGGRAGLGFLLGRILVLGVFRFTIDALLTGPGSAYDTHRLGLEGRVFIGVPFELSRVTLIPGIDIGGGGVQRWRRIESNSMAVDDYTHEGQGGARLAGHLMLDFPLKRGFGLLVDLSFSFSLPSDRYVLQNGGFPVAGEPLGSGQIGFGMRYDYPLGRKRRDR